MKVNFRKIAFVSLCILFAFGLSVESVQAVASNLIITEIMYNPEGADTGGKVSEGTFYSHEWTEVYNASNQQIDLTDWRFHDGANHILNPPPEKGGQGSMVIQPGEYVVLANDAGTFLAGYPEFSGTVIDTVMSLNNTSDTPSLIDPDGNVIDSVIYQDSWGGDGNGKSLEKIDSNGSNTADNWGDSQTIKGTPGAINSTSGQQIPPEPEPEPVCQPTEEICDGIDNDCDDLIDEDLSETTCGIGACAATVANCINGVTQSCIPGDPIEEACDQIDNNCDGQIDEGDICEIPEPPVEPQPTEEPPEEETEDETPPAEEPQPIPIIYPSNIFINEFLPSPEGPDSEMEWIELYNDNPVTVDISNWTVEDTQGSIKTYTFPENAVLQDYGFLILYRPASKIVLNNDGEGLILKNPASYTVDSVSYQGKASEAQSFSKKNSGTWGWTTTLTPGGENIFTVPTETETETQSETQITEEPFPSQDLADEETTEDTPQPEPNEQSHEVEPREIGGESLLEEKTGAEKEFEPKIYPSGIFINEILPSPEGPDSEGEWIEIFNENSFEADLSGWQIQDANGRIKNYVFPQGTKISSKGFLVFSRPATKITLNNDEDAVSLILPDGKAVSQVSYSKAPAGKSYNRTPGLQEWLWSDTLTPGLKNIIPDQAAKNTKKEKPGEINEFSAKGQAALGPQIFGSSQGLSVILVAIVVAIFSGTVILIIKKRIESS